jgi:hypothetical protein
MQMRCPHRVSARPRVALLRWDIHSQLGIFTAAGCSCGERSGRQTAYDGFDKGILPPSLRRPEAASAYNRALRLRFAQAEPPMTVSHAPHSLPVFLAGLPSSKSASCDPSGATGVRLRPWYPAASDSSLLPGALHSIDHSAGHTATLVCSSDVAVLPHRSAMRR